MASYFDIAIKKLLEAEGGFVHDPLDRGGMTFAGIARRYQPNWEGWEIIDQLLVEKTIPTLANIKLNELVSQFYLDNFWKPLKCDSIKFQGFSDYLIDWAVNSGPSDAIRGLQAALNRYRIIKKFQGFAPLKEDGVIGAKTIAAVNIVGVADVEIVMKQFRAQRILHYIKVILANPLQLRFAVGWILRALD